MSEEQKENKVEEKATYQDFYEYFKEKPDVPNSEYYKEFPDVPPSTIRRWKSKARKEFIPPQEKANLPQSASQASNAPETDEALQTAVDALIEATRTPKSLLEGMDLKAQLTFLRNVAKNKTSVPPANQNILPLPVGAGKPKMEIDKYLKIDPDRREIRLEIPASLALGNPEKMKNLTKMS